MADADDTKNQEDSKQEKDNKKADEGDKKSLIGSLLPWIIMAVAVAVCAGAGLGLGRLLAGPGQPETAEPSQQAESAQASQFAEIKADSSAAGQKTWYYELEPVVANLDVPGVTRYVRATLILEISSEVDQKKGVGFIENKKPILINWLTIHLASLSIEDIRGDRNLKRIQSQILDAFNEELFPDSEPHIKHILFKEFAIQ